MIRSPGEIVQSEASSFLVYSIKRRNLKWQGMIFRYNSDSSKRSFYFISNKILNKYGQAFREVVIDALNPLDFTSKDAVIKSLI